MLPARQCFLPLSAGSQVRHTFGSALLLTTHTHSLSCSHLGTCEPVAGGLGGGGGESQLELPADPPLLLCYPDCLWF